jgi:hypothetical protein
MMMDDYCQRCHQDAYQGWFHSAHRFSSFNNKPYLVLDQRDAAGRLETRRQSQGVALVRRLP